MEDKVNVSGPPVIELDPPETNPQSLEKTAKKSGKRKRDSIEAVIGNRDRESLILEYNREIQSLYAYFTETLSQKLNLEVRAGGLTNSINALIACLLEESSLPFSNLVEEIYGKVKTLEGTTLASVRSAVLFVGQRSMYGVANADADVLEDNSKSCLWCWEARDMKLFPNAQRGVLSIRRTSRKKIHERISSLSAIISALSAPEACQDSKADMLKAYEKLSKTLNEVQIRLLVENLLQKNDSNLASKEAKLKEKELIKELEKNNREVEKEKKRADRELQKAKLQIEKEKKRLQDEHEKEERRREKEEAELKKLLKRQQEEAEKDKKRREKEESEVKKQLALQKQATIMERFLKRKNAASDDKLSAKISLVESRKSEVLDNCVSSSMDAALSRVVDTHTSDLLKSHMATWQKFRISIHCNRSQHWGIRRKPKRKLVMELKLQGPSSELEPAKQITTSIKEATTQKLGDFLEETIDYEDASTSGGNVGCSPATNHLCCKMKKLLQFDKSHRPAYYGTFSKKSDVVGPRCPLRKDPNMDYDFDSDEEWEEEDPGESLSDCEKDEVEQTLEEGDSKNDDDVESEDSFFVPDGYLSEDEGVQVDKMEIDPIDEVRSAHDPSKEDVESEEFRVLLRNKKYLNSVTEHALRKNQPLIISNLRHEKSALIATEDLSGIARVEMDVLQALSMRPYCIGMCIEISTDHREDHEVSHLESTSNSKHPMTGADMSELDLPKVISTVQSCSFGLTKVVELLQLKYPNISKHKLRNIVREIADFVDNRWQVKKEILSKLGPSPSPEKGAKRKGVISNFFSKRCMPASCGTVDLSGSSPPPCVKPGSEVISVDDNSQSIGNQD